MANLTDAYFYRTDIVKAIMGRPKYVNRLKPLANESAYAYERGRGFEFEKVCRGYVIGEYQKLGIAFDDEDIEWAVADIHWKIERLV